jgi:hypothetical protein
MVCKQKLHQTDDLFTKSTPEAAREVDGLCQKTLVFAKSG